MHTTAYSALLDSVTRLFSESIKQMCLLILSQSSENSLNKINLKDV